MKWTNHANVYWLIFTEKPKTGRLDLLKNPLPSKIKHLTLEQFSRAILFLPIKIKTRRNTLQSVFLHKKKKKKIETLPKCCILSHQWERGLRIVFKAQNDKPRQMATNGDKRRSLRSSTDNWPSPSDECMYIILRPQSRARQFIN